MQFQMCQCEDFHFRSKQFIETKYLTQETISSPLKEFQEPTSKILPSVQMCREQEFWFIKYKKQMIDDYIFK